VGRKGNRDHIAFSIRSRGHPRLTDRIQDRLIERRVSRRANEAGIRQTAVHAQQNVHQGVELIADTFRDFQRRPQLPEQLCKIEIELGTAWGGAHT
jgi:hypothetical protein